jgi:hypothetical protein
MTFKPADTASVVVFVAMSVVMVIVLVVALRRGGASRRMFLVLGGGLSAFTGIVASGALADPPLPAIPIVFVAILGSALAVAWSPVGRRLSATSSLAVLVGFQAFRLPLELVLHHWAEVGTIPGTMTWTGDNLDIIAGAVALVAAPAASLLRDRSRGRWARAFAWVAQIVGVVLLLNVLRVVVMSSPLPFAWGVEPPLQLLGHLPYAWIGPLFVAPAVAAHVITIRRLLVRPA